MIKNIEDIKVWVKAKTLTLKIYASFKTCKDFSFRDQIQRATISIMNNIAEGYERGGNKEFRQFLYIAKGSCGEVRSMLRIAPELGFLTQEEAAEYIQQSEEISKMISGLIKSLGLHLSP
jgi:four helix bundle protein